MESQKIIKDIANKRITIERTFKSDKARLWKAWTTAEQLVKWWGPKEWPASSKSFDFRIGGYWHYCMTGPDGTQAWGWVDYISIKEMDSFDAIDCFCDAKGMKNIQLPTTQWQVRFIKVDEISTKVMIEMNFSTGEELNRIVAMGFEAGFSSALDNLEELLSGMQQHEGIR